MRRSGGRTVGRVGDLRAACAACRPVHSSSRPPLRPSVRPIPRPSVLGFSLLEVLTALALTGLVALLAHRLMAATIDGVRTLEAARQAQDRRENGRRWLRAAFLSLQPDGAGGFVGDPDRVQFTAWLQQPEGWFAGASVTLAVRTGGLWADHGSGPAVRLAESVVGMECDYLLVPGADARWVRQWHSPLSAPLAVRLRLLHQDGQPVDTFLLLVRERG